MSMAVPKEIRDRVRKKIWDKADELNWSRMSDLDRATWYENWSKGKDIGELLAHFMDPRKVRVYIKDSLLKPYLRTRLEELTESAMLAVGLKFEDTSFKSAYDKPHGRLLVDGRVICWGNSRDWKSILISVYERSYRLDSGIPYAAVLVEGGKTTSFSTRELISGIGGKLGLIHVVWID